MLITRKGADLCLANCMKADLEVPDGRLIEQGMDHCLCVAVNIFAGGRLLCCLDDGLDLANKGFERVNKRRRLVNFLKRRGCKFSDQAVLPYLTVNNQIEWGRLSVKTVSYRDTVSLLSCANHLNQYLDEFPDRVMIQIDKLPLSNDNLFHCSHVLNAKFDKVEGEWYLRDTEGGWYSTRSYDDGGISQKYSSSHFNTFRDAYKVRIWSLEPLGPDNEQSEATMNYVERVEANQGATIRQNMLQKGPGNLTQLTKQTPLLSTNPNRSHLGKKADRKQQKKLYQQQKRLGRSQSANDDNVQQTVEDVSVQLLVEPPSRTSSENRRMAGRPKKNANVFKRISNNSSSSSHR